MNPYLHLPLLAGKNIFVSGVADEHSIAWGCARAFHEMGAEVALSCRNAADEAVVRPLADRINAPLFRLDVSVPGAIAHCFDALGQHYGRLDSVLHSIAFAPKQDLHGPLSQCSREGFLKAMDCSVYSFIEMARCAAPLMVQGGTLFTMSYHGAQRVVDHYSLMGPAKAALESTVRYLAHELGPAGIRVHAISPGPIHTRAASGIAQFDHLVDETAHKAPAGSNAGIEDVGYATAMLAADHARLITGSTLYVDGGAHIMG